MIKIDETKCIMESRLVELETKQRYMYDEIKTYKDALEKNTVSLNKLCLALARHEQILTTQNNRTNNAQALITGITVGVILLGIQVAYNLL